MEVKNIILDANIGIKILHSESDSEVAQKFLQACITENRKFFVPEHFLYELVNVCQRLGVQITNALKLFEAMKGSLLTIMTPEYSTWLLAEKIAKEGHQKSGFPTMYDSIYHALAIETNGVFVTADKRHFAKAERFFHICLLENWYSLF